jgi:hypothetical protein
MLYQQFGKALAVAARRKGGFMALELYVDQDRVCHPLAFAPPIH